MSQVPTPPYVSIEQLSQLTPWTIGAIRSLIKRAMFQEGKHYFRPMGKGGRVIFKWAAVVELIEGDTQTVTVDAQVANKERDDSVIPMPGGKAINVREALQTAERMLD